MRATLRASCVRLENRSLQGRPKKTSMLLAVWLAVAGGPRVGAWVGGPSEADASTHRGARDGRSRAQDTTQEFYSRDYVLTAYCKAATARQRTRGTASAPEGANRGTGFSGVP